MWRCAERSCYLRRVLGIFRYTASALCLILFLAILLFWLTTPRVIWWNHSDPLPYYHLATIRNLRLEFGFYRETSFAHWRSWSMEGLKQQLELTSQELKEQSKTLDDLVTRTDLSSYSPQM